jgi:hypothetical protein
LVVRFALSHRALTLHHHRRRALRIAKLNAVRHRAPQQVPYPRRQQQRAERAVCSDFRALRLPARRRCRHQVAERDLQRSAEGQRPPLPARAHC